MAGVVWFPCLEVVWNLEHLSTLSQVWHDWTLVLLQCSWWQAHVDIHNVLYAPYVWHGKLKLLHILSWACTLGTYLGLPLQHSLSLLFTPASQKKLPVEVAKGLHC